MEEGRRLQELFSLGSFSLSRSEGFTHQQQLSRQRRILQLLCKVEKGMALCIQITQGSFKFVCRMPFTPLLFNHWKNSPTEFLHFLQFLSPDPPLLWLRYKTMGLGGEPRKEPQVVLSCILWYAAHSSQKNQSVFTGKYKSLFVKLGFPMQR